LCFIHAEGPAVEQCTVHLGYRLLGLGIGAHRDEPETARFPGFAVGRDVHVADFPERGESGA
jgi:hypothetical protein